MADCETSPASGYRRASIITTCSRNLSVWAIELTTRRPDLYHTCNNLSGLSIAQHHLVHSSSTVQSNRARFDKTKGFPAIKPTKPEGGWKSEEERQAVRREVWANALGWEEVGECLVGGKESRVVGICVAHSSSWLPEVLGSNRKWLR